MRDEFIQALTEAARRVIHAETKLEVKPGEISLQEPTYVSRDLTIMVGVLGNIQGTILYGMSEKTAIDIVSEILQYKYDGFNYMVASAVREICNVITSMATIDLEKLGYSSKITPPTLITGCGVGITTFHLQRILIPMQSDFGDIDISAVLVDKNLAPYQLAI